MNSTLAIDGGSPIRSTVLPYARQDIDDADISAVTSALRSDWLTTGPRVPEFEKAVAATAGSSYAVAFSSGTAALHAAMATLGVGPGDDVITSPLTFVATANAALYTGAEPRFADIDSDTLLLDASAAARAITPRTKVIVPVDYAGQPADYDALRQVAASVTGRRIPILADAAHSLGATWRGDPVGSLADLTVLSLHPAKILTTGEGGVVLANDEHDAVRLRRFRNHGIATELADRRDWKYDMVDLGYNYRLTDVMAALGTSQIARLGSFLAARRGLAATYRAAFADHWAVDLQAVDSRADPAWHLFVVLLRLDRLQVDRGAVFRALRAEGIGVNVHYLPVYRHQYYQRHYPDSGGNCPVADGAYDRLLTLPLYPSMTAADVSDVITAFNKVTDAYRVR